MKYTDKTFSVAVGSNAYTTGWDRTFKKVPVRRARKLAEEKSRHAAHRHAVLICRGRRIIGAGYNHDAVHAEVDALRKTQGDLAGCEAVSVRVTKGNRLGTARPCPECWRALKEAGIRVVRWTGSDGRLISERL